MREDHEIGPFIRELRKNEDWRNIPVVILTAKDLTIEDRANLKGNVELVLQKGDYSRERLLDEVRDMVRSSLVEGQETGEEGGSG